MMPAGPPAGPHDPPPPAPPDGEPTEARTERAPADPALRSTLRMLLAPGVFYVAMLLLGLASVPYLLQAFAAIYGLVLFRRSLTDQEPLLAVTIVYLPLSKEYAGAVAPFVNGSNLLIVMLLIGWYMRTSQQGLPFFTSMRHTGLVWAWAGLSSFSALTAMWNLGVDFIVGDHLLDFKSWVDQFIFYFAFLNLIKDAKMAKRLVVYMVVGFLVVMVLGTQELIEKADASSIEKSRLLGPQLQPNDFGAYLVYAASPLMAYCVHNFMALRTWLASPVFVILARLLLTTFSRGAYIGLGFAAAAAGYVRGKLFLAGSLLFLVALLSAFPQLIPASFTARMGQTKDEGAEKLDKSAETRLILWKAGVAMTLDHPILGTGFKAFQALKADYTETEVEESDNHNMFLFISSQMGIPALIVFLVLLYQMYATGAALYRSSTDTSTRIVGLGGAIMVAGVIGVNMFGSRMGEVCVNGDFWVYLAVLAHLWPEREAGAPAIEHEAALSVAGTG